MSADLLEQLAQYGADHRARQEPVERTEIVRRVRGLREPVQDAGRRAERPRTRLLVATAAVTVALIGGLLLLTTRDPSAQTNVPDTDQIRTTQPSVPLSTAPTTTAAPSTTAPTDQADSTAQIPDRLSITANVTVGEPAAVAGTAYAETGVDPALVPWNDGFLLVTASGRFSPVELSAEFSTDGDNWTPVEIGSPVAVDEVHQIAVVGDRVVVVGTQPLDLLDDPAAEFRAMIVASTVDLTRWSIQAVPGVAGTRPGLVDSLGGLQFVANERGWVAHVEPHRCEVDSTGEVACGRPGSLADTGTFPDVGEVRVSEFAAGEGPPLTWAAAWDVEPVPVGGPVGNENVTVTALPTGFLAQHDVVEFSADGTTWAPIPEAPLDAGLAGALPLDDGGSAVVSWDWTSCQTRYYHVDGAGHGWELIELDIDGAPRSLLPSSPFGPVVTSTARIQPSSASLFDASGPVVSTARLEQDALELTLVSCGRPGSSTANAEISVLYEVVDTDTGETLVAETGSRWPRDDPDAFEHLTIGDDDALTVRDPSSGDVLFDASFGDEVVVDTGVRGREGIWLLATTSGTDWLVDDLESDSTDQGGQDPLQAVRNGDTILVATTTDWLRYELPAR